MDIAKRNIFRSYLDLKGNPKVIVNFHVLFCIPFYMFNFYYSVYMREMGVSDIQIGYLVSIGNFATALASLFCGNLIDRCGRKRFIFIIDGILWPVVLLIRLFSISFFGFALAAVIGSAGSIGNIAFQFMLSEDVDEEKRVTGFNMVNVILLGSGIFTFTAGYFVDKYGVVAAERGFFIFAIITYIFRTIVRNQLLEETKTGIKAKNEAKEKGYRIESCLSKDVVQYILHHSGTRAGVIVFLCFHIFTVFGALSSSMYYVPYLTDNLGFNAATASLFGTILSVGMLFVSTLVVPILFKFGIFKNIISGAGILIISMFFIMLAPYQNIGWMILCNILYSLGYGIIKPNVDTLLANVIEGKRRASVYSMVTLLSTILGTMLGFVSGFIFAYFPIFLFGVATVFLLLMIITILLSYKSCNTRDFSI